MALYAKDNGGEDFERAPIGNQQAVCVFVEDIGTHESNYQGETISRHQIVICWELLEKMTTGKPFMLSKFYTLSLSKKSNLRRDLVAWRGAEFTPNELEAFDVEKLKGANCLLNIIADKKDDGREYRKISSISPLVKGIQKITPINTVLPAWIQKMRNESQEEKSGKTASDLFSDGSPVPDNNDTLPF